MTVRCAALRAVAEAGGLRRKIVICAAPEVSARSRRRPCFTKKSIAVRGDVDSSAAMRKSPRCRNASRMLRQANSLGRVNFLQFILSREIQNGASGVALHRLRSRCVRRGLCRSTWPYAAGFVCRSATFQLRRRGRATGRQFVRRRLWRVTFPVASTCSTLLSAPGKMSPRRLLRFPRRVRRRG